MHEKLKHLTKDQVDEVVRKYKDKTIKLSDIVKEYGINIDPQGLLRVLPLEVLEKKCEYCNHNLTRKILCRSSITTSPNIPKCSNCGHVEDNRYSKCTCKYCLKKKEQLMLDRRDMIFRTYSKIIPKSKFCDLSLKDQFTVYNLIKFNKRDSYEQIYPLIDTSHLYDEDDFFYFEYESEREPITSNIINDCNYLLSKNIISIAPDNRADVFLEDNFPYKIDITKAKFNLNIIFNENEVSKLRKDNYFLNKSHDVDDLLSLWIELLYWDARERFTTMLEVRKLRFKYSQNGDILFKDLISKIGYTQLMHLCYRVARNLSDDCLIGLLLRDEASEIAYEFVSTYYKNYVDLGYELKHYKRNCSSEKLIRFIENVLGKDITILKLPPSLFNLDNFKDHFEYSVKRIVDVSKYNK